MSENYQPQGRRPEDKPSVQFPSLDGFKTEDSVQFPDLNEESAQFKRANREELPEQSESISVEDVSVEVPDLDEQDEIEYERSRGAFFNWAQRQTDEQWKRFQIIGGVAVGAAASACIALIPTQEGGSFFSWSFIAAIVIAMLLPNFVEKRSGRSIGLARKILLIVLVVFIFGLLAYHFFTGSFNQATA